MRPSLTRFTGMVDGEGGRQLYNNIALQRNAVGREMTTDPGRGVNRLDQ